MTCTLLVEMGVPHYLWTDALLTSLYLLNRLPSSPLGGEVPLRRLHPTRDLFALPPRVFGCVAFVHDHTPNLSKLAPRYIKGVFVGYSCTQKGYRIYLPEQRKYVISADATFFEDTRHFASSSTPISPPSLQPPTMASSTSPSSSPSSNDLPTPLLADSPPAIPLQILPAPHAAIFALVSETPLDKSSTSLANPPPLEEPPADLHLPIALWKGKHNCTLHPISHFVCYDQLSPSYRAFSLALSSESIPKTYLEAMKLPHWKAAMDLEFEALNQRETWVLVPRPQHTNIVTCRWIFTMKYNSDGTINRHKARLVAHGFSQTYDVDYKETFSPVVRLNSVRILLSLAVNQGWSLHQLDVSNAFFYGELTEQVFMEQPPRYVHSGGGGTDKVCHLHRAIYGLKQSPRAWFAKVSQLVLAFGITACTMDPTVFRKHTSAGSILLAVYVDDILVTRSDTTRISQVKSHLQKHLNIRDLDTPKYFLGIEFAYKRGKLILNQCKYVLDILEETCLLGCKPQSSPIDSKPQFWDSTSPPLTDANIYQCLVGKLIYLTVTRPDITYTVGLLSQFMHSPQEIHCHAAPRVLAYLKHAPERGLLYQHHGHLRIEDILILAMQAIVATENPLPDFVFWLEGITSLGGVKNNELYHF